MVLVQTFSLDDSVGANISRSKAIDYNTRGSIAFGLGHCFMDFGLEHLSAFNLFLYSRDWNSSSATSFLIPLA